MTEVSINKQAKLSEHLTLSSAAALSHSCVPTVASDQRSSASELDGSRLSPHFTLREMCKTSAKTADGNIPSHVHIENLKRLCGWLEMPTSHQFAADDPSKGISAAFQSHPKRLIRLSY